MFFGNCLGPNSAEQNKDPNSSRVWSAAGDQRAPQLGDLASPVPLQERRGFRRSAAALRRAFASDETARGGCADVGGPEVKEVEATVVSWRGFEA